MDGIHPYFSQSLVSIEMCNTGCRKLKKIGNQISSDLAYSVKTRTCISQTLLERSYEVLDLHMVLDKVLQVQYSKSPQRRT